MTGQEPKPEERHLLFSKARLSEAETILERIMQLSEDVGQWLKTSGAASDEATLCDLGFMFREMENLFDSARRECGHKQKQVGKLLALKITKRALRGGEAKAVGSMASATPDVKMRPNLPRKDTPEWDSLLSRLGVNEEARSNKLVRLHWPDVGAWLTKLVADGKAPPPELSKILEPESTCTYRRRKNRK